MLGKATPRRLSGKLEVGWIGRLAGWGWGLEVGGERAGGGAAQAEGSRSIPAPRFKPPATLSNSEGRARLALPGEKAENVVKDPESERQGDGQHDPHSPGERKRTCRQKTGSESRAEGVE